MIERITRWNSCRTKGWTPIHRANGCRHSSTVDDLCCRCMVLDGHIRGLGSRIRSSLFSLLSCDAYPYVDFGVNVLRRHSETNVWITFLVSFALSLPISLWLQTSTSSLYLSRLRLLTKAIGSAVGPQARCIRSSSCLYLYNHLLFSSTLCMGVLDANTRSL